MSFGHEVLALRWEHPGNGGHADLTLRLGNWIHTCDSYFFAIDAENTNSNVTKASVAGVIQQLLRQWMERVTELGENEITYLPFDFSDQCSAWVRVVRSGDRLEVQPGWSVRLTGISLSPSNLSHVQPTDWEPIAEASPVITSTPDLTVAITHSIAALRAHQR
jgi:hypothetical protein